ncbi:MAG: DUF4430 domain-containing protein [Clostridia bacterium]|nr:DUF4430 domain-containing protein [Clostridia bacterium]
MKLFGKMKKATFYLLGALLTLALAALTACGGQKPKVVSVDENSVIIRPDKNVLEITETTTLTDYLNALNDKGMVGFEYVIENGMVVSMNGLKQNNAESKFWMLYTSDAEKSNTAWGVLEYDGKQYGSATVGASELIIKEGETYIWCYQKVSY